MGSDFCDTMCDYIPDTGIYGSTPRKIAAQLEGSLQASFSCRGRCASGFNCHQASGQCRSNPNTPQTSCVGTCTSGYCCNKNQNRCDTCSAEEAVGGFGGDCKQADLDAGCKTVMEPFGWTFVPTCQCPAPPKSASVFMTADSSRITSTDVAVYGFAVVALGFLLHKASRHFFGTKTGSTVVEFQEV